MVVGNFRECPECGTLVEGTAGKHKHIGYHDRLNELLESLKQAIEKGGNGSAA